VSPKTVCVEPHADPIQLPSPEEHIPQYLIDVINAYRTENPNNKPPAWKLSKMFSPTMEESKCHTEALKEHDDPSVGTPKYLTRWEECRKIYEREENYDNCAQRTTQRLLHCNMCNTGDYDLCTRCLSQVAHCFSDEHYLREMAGLDSKEKYYSSEKEHAGRDVISL
jgi:hypothetical protein